MPWTPPINDRDYLRANLWGVPCPGGLPYVKRGSSEHPDRIWTVFAYKSAYRNYLPTMLRTHRDRGNFHWYLSWGDARDDGGFSLSDFRSLCQYVRRAGFWVHAKIATKPAVAGNDIPGDPKDMDPAQWKAYIDPVFDALAGAVDEYGVWEWDLWNLDGEASIDTLNYFGQRAHAQDASFWYHGSAGRTHWDPLGRFHFWDNLPNVNGIDYQSAGLAWATPQEYQARIVDTLSQFGAAGNVHKFRWNEDVANDLVFNPNIDNATAETIGDSRGFFADCTVDNVNHTDAKVWGRGDGGRTPGGLWY